MKTYQDSVGDTCQAQQLEGPTFLNTTEGECCGEAGQWVLYIPSNKGRPVLISNQSFLASFTLVE
jgi:hypothetical protein